jgi:hypothetical protein
LSSSSTKSVFLTYPAGKSVNLNESGNVSPLGTVSSGVWQGSTVGVAYGGTGVTASSGANSVVLRDSNQNIAVNRLNQANTNINAASGTTILTAASTYSQTLTGTGNQTFAMPDATTLTTGVAFAFNNNATGTLTLTDYASGAIGTITSGGAAALILLANGTVAGTWNVHGFLPENVTWGTNALNLGSTVITNGTWNGGTIQPAYGGTGLTTFVGANNALYSTGASTLTAGVLPAAAGGTGITSFTANGVVYASSSSALATGSALTFDGTTLQNTNQIRVQTAAGTAPKFYIGQTLTSAWSIGSPASVDALVFVNEQFTTESMRLNSVGLGIGTNNPAQKLQVSANEPKIRITSTAASGKSWDISSGGNTTVTLGHFCIYDTTTDAQRFNIISGSGQLLLDGSGNLGLNATPSAWSVNYKALQSGNGSSFVGFSGNNQTFVVSNAYNDGAWKYIQTSGAGYYNIGGVANGQHSWFIAPSGTAGNAITFTQAMTLDASGNLALGTTSANGRATIVGNTVDIRNTAGAYGTGYALELATNATIPRIDFIDNSAYTGNIKSSGGVFILQNTANAALTLGTNNTERARIDSNGNLLLGVTSVTNSSRLVVRGASGGGYNSTFSQSNSTVQIISDEMSANQWYPTFNIAMVRQSLTTGNGAFGGIGFSTIDDSNNSGMNDAGRIAIINESPATVESGTAMAFYTQVGSFTRTNPAQERMRLDSSGNLGLGTTSIGGTTSNRQLTIVGSSASQITLTVSGSFSVNVGTNGSLGYIETTSTAPLTFVTNGAERARIDSSGNMIIGATSSAGARLTVAGNLGATIGNNPSGIRMTNTDTGNYASISAGLVGVTNVGMDFSVDGTRRMSIDSSGNLLVGTPVSAGGAGVTVGSTSAGKVVSVFSSSYGNNGVFNSYGTDGNLKYQAGALGDTAAFVYAHTGCSLNLYSGGNLSATLSSGGNFGIGTSSPSTKLDVAGTIGLSPGAAIGIIRRTTVNGSNGIRLQGNASDSVNTDAAAGAYINIGGGVIGDTFEGNIDIVAYGGNVDANRNQIKFFNRSGVNTVTERMRIDKDGNVGIGRSDPPMRLSAAAAGAVISGTATIGTNMQGIQVYNANSATANNAVGLWFATGPHQAGIASFRSAPDSGWDTVLAFYTHNAATSGLTDCYERMRITGEGNVSIGTSGEKARLFVAGNSAAIALGSFRPNDGFARSIEVCYGQSGTFNTLTIEVNLNGPGGWCYELNIGGTSGGLFATGGGYINGAVNFGHTTHTIGGSGSLVVSGPSGDIVRFVVTGGIGVHPVCTFKITGSLSQDFSSSNISVVFS